MEVQYFSLRKVAVPASQQRKFEKPFAVDEPATEGDTMPNTGQVACQQTTQLRAKDACPHCGKAPQHESWCVTTNLSVRYAYAIVLSSSLLAPGDALILHSLGVIW
jgi:hypothetical protein